MKKIFLMIFCFYANSILGNNLAFENKVITQTDNEPKYLITINYPQIKNPSNNSENQFNVITQNWTVAQINKFKATIKDWDTSNLPATLKNNGSSLTIHYDLAILVPQKLLSIRFYADTYFVGAAHPSHIYKTLNYDLAHNKELNLADLFKPNSNYLTKISNIATEKITADLNSAADGKAEVFKEGLMPVAKNYQLWNITPDGLKFTFNEYQVAAYVFGPQEVIIPYQDLKPYLSSDSLLSSCVNHCEIKKIDSIKGMVKTG